MAPTPSGSAQAAPDDADPGKLVDQWVKVADHYVSIQADLARSLVARWTTGGKLTPPPSGQSVWETCLDSMGDVVQAYFTWIQLLDVIAGSGWNKGAGGTTPAAGTSAKSFRIPGNQATTVALPQLDNGGGTILKTGITLSPTSVTATAREVTVTVTPPAGTPYGNYRGSIVDGAGAPLLYVKILVHA
jgi:hypothetical protein